MKKPKLDTTANKIRIILIFLQLNLSNYSNPKQIKYIIIGKRGSKNLSSLWADKLNTNIVNAI